MSRKKDLNRKNKMFNTVETKTDIVVVRSPEDSLFEDFSINYRVKIVNNILFR